MEVIAGDAVVELASEGSMPFWTLRSETRRATRDGEPGIFGADAGNLGYSKAKRGGKETSHIRRYNPKDTPKMEPATSAVSPSRISLS